MTENETIAKVKEIEELLNSLMKDHKAEVGAFMHFLKETIQEKSLSTKTKELISTALSVATGCEWCIALHVKNALDAGATKDEIIEACFVAVLMAGGPALMHLIPVMDAIKTFEKK